MATTYKSAQVTNGLVRGNWRGSNFTVYGTLTPGSAALGDIYQLCIVPNGYSIVAVTLDCAQLDSNASPTVVLEVGDGTTAGRFITGSTVGKTGGIQVANVAGTIGYSYSLGEGGQFGGGNAGGTIVQAQVTTAAATFKSGVVALAIECYLDPQLGGYT